MCIQNGHWIGKDKLKDTKTRARFNTACSFQQPNWGNFEDFGVVGVSIVLRCGQSDQVYSYGKTVGSDWSSHAHLLYVLGWFGSFCVATPIRSYCFTVQMELIGPAALNGVPPKHNNMQQVAFVREMSHFVVCWGCIFMDQLATESTSWPPGMKETESSAGAWEASTLWKPQWTFNSKLMPGHVLTYLGWESERRWLMQH